EFRNRVYVVVTAQGSFSARFFLRLDNSVCRRLSQAGGSHGGFLSQRPISRNYRLSFREFRNRVYVVVDCARQFQFARILSFGDLKSFVSETPQSNWRISRRISVTDRHEKLSVSLESSGIVLRLVTVQRQFQFARILSCRRLEIISL
ncbi:hypothetical protein AVEN_25-2-1, partial [Araneus ventricosus]